MGSLKGGGSSPQTQRTEPWAQQAPYLQQGFQQASNLYQTGGPQFYGGATYAPFSQQTEQGLAMTQERALGGSPVTDAAQNFATQALTYNPQFSGAQDYLNQAPSLEQSTQPFTSQLTGIPDATQQALSSTAAGESLMGNPYLDQQFDLAAQRVTDRFNESIAPNIAAQFSAAGRTGSDAQGRVLTDAAGEVSDSLSGLANHIYGGNYQAERDRQLQAAGQLGGLSQAQQGLGLQAAGQGASLFGQGQGNQLQAAGIDANVYGQQLGQQTQAASLANSLANQDYADIDRLLGVGGRVEGLANQAIQDQRQRFDHYQNLPQQNLANYIAAIQGNYGGTTTAQGGQNQRSPLAGAAGGALTGAQIGGPWGALIGGGLGLLAG